MFILLIKRHCTVVSLHQQCSGVTHCVASVTDLYSIDLSYNCVLVCNFQGLRPWLIDVRIRSPFFSWIGSRLWTRTFIRTLRALVDGMMGAYEFRRFFSFRTAKKCHFTLEKHSHEHFHCMPLTHEVTTILFLNGEQTREGYHGGSASQS